MLSEQSYLAKFETRDLGPEEFDHRGHLYMAWLHLKHFPLDEANQRVCQGIRDLANKYGVPDKYNRTLSEALMRIMGQRMQATQSDSFENFVEANPDLVTDARGILLGHYSPGLLHSAVAKTSWVEPDLKPFA